MWESKKQEWINKKKDYKPIFSYNSDITKNAYVNWRMDQHDQRHNFNTIAKGYMDASLKLAEVCLKDNSNKIADELIFPMLFNADHAIELYLKSIMWSLHWLLDSTETYSGGHDIRQLFQTVRVLVEDFCDKYKIDTVAEFKSQTENLEQYIDELYLILHPDNNGRPTKKENLDFSRYPMQSDKKSPYFYAEQTWDNKTVDLTNYVIRFREIGSNLDSIAGYFDYELDQKLDYEAEMQREYESEMAAEYARDVYNIGYYW